MSRASAHKPGAKSAPRLDAANLAGITTLMNPQHIKVGTNLDMAEKSIMGKHPEGKKAEGDPVRVYTTELNRLAEELGIDMGDGGAPPSAAPANPNSVSRLIDDLDLDSAPRRARPAKAPSRRSGSSRSGSSRSGSSRSGSSRSGSSGSGSSRSGSSGSSYSGSSYTGSESGSYTDSESGSETGSSYTGSSYSGSSRSSRSGDDAKVDDIITRLESDLGIQTDRRHSHRHRVDGKIDVPIVERRHHREEGTDDQKRRSHITSVVSDIRGETHTATGVEAERLQDLKASKLEQIGQLRMSLEEEGIECDSVGCPTSNSPITEIDSVLNILRLKNDRNRYSSLAEEVILGCAEGIETVFDGTREIPLLGWRPDYTGYHSTVNVKLHRMRFETSQVVGTIIQRFNIGPTSRILMELLPSFFLYPRQQQKQRGAPGLSSDPHVADARGAISAIRYSDERQLDNVRGI